MDRLGDVDADPDTAHVDSIYAEITGQLGGDDTLVPLGFVTLDRIDLWEVGDEMGEALDSASAEWTAYLSLLEGADDPRYLLISSIVPRSCNGPAVAVLA